MHSAVQWMALSSLLHLAADPESWADHVAPAAAGPGVLRPIHSPCLSLLCPSLSQDRVVMPNAERHAQYRQHYAAYKALYPALKPVFHSAAAAREAEATLATAAAAADGSRQQGVAQQQQREALHSIVSPSILSADFANLARDVKRVVEAGEVKCC